LSTVKVEIFAVDALKSEVFKFIVLKKVVFIVEELITFNDVVDALTTETLIREFIEERVPQFINFELYEKPDELNATVSKVSKF